MNYVQIGSKKVGDGLPPLVIAEAGINHNGDVSIAKEMVGVAKDIGVDIIKFQTHIPAAEMLQDKKPDGDSGSHITRSLYDIMVECSLTKDDHIILKEEAEKLGIMFLSTPFSIEAVELLVEIDVPAFKIGSGEITNIPFLKYVAAKGKPIILSTGTADWNETVTSVMEIKDLIPGLILMQCTSNYPTQYKDINLGVLDKMRAEFDIPVGLSDHCTGNYACFGAIAKGACLVEKHFTLSRSMPGVDQSSSLEPDEFKDLVEGVKAIYSAFGDEKKLNEEAEAVRRGFSESIVTIAPISKGDSFKEQINVWVKRPGTGIPSYELPNIIGKKASRDLQANQLLRNDDIVQ